ncbi:MAG: hypothetical protein WBQ21_12485 [Solirubrobacteraceae bacterium]
MVATRPRLFAGGASIVLLALWIVCSSAPTSAFAAGLSRSYCSSSDGLLGCARTPAIAHASEAEPEEELEEGAEEAATAEVEAEEEAEGSQLAGSPSHRAGSSGVAVLSDLRLTAQATAALDRHRPSASEIGFSFMLSAPSKVRVTLVEQSESHGHKRWTELPDSLTVNAAAGRVSRTLGGHNHLSPGRYRLSVTPLMGRPRSIYLNARE